MLLPIDGQRQRIEAMIRNNQVTIIVGETGSGKTTRLPIFLKDCCSGEGIIGITEPRRLAATSVARYVAEQLGTKLGEEVGYQVRFDNEATVDTKIKFMTDGILLREIQVDPNLTKYSVIMVDEAHERSVNIDFVLGLLKDLLKRRSDLKVVVASATIDSEKFSRYFDDAPVVLVSGRTYEVDIRWGEDVMPREIPNAVIARIESIHTKEPEGDILAFMTGMDDIDQVVEGLEDKYNDMVVLPAHGGLAPEDQKLIFDRFPGKRKVVVATNIAETSLTIDGVVYVVDSGLVKQTSFNPETGIQSLNVTSHSKAGCNQRAGRAGRTRPGICYRMFSATTFGYRPDYTEPEIRRLSLAGVVLSMEAIGISDVENFEFVDQPDKQAFHEAYETLIALGAIKSDRQGLTALGIRMANLPLEPRMARMVLEADQHGCVKEIATIAAFMSIRSVFARPKGKERDADMAHMKFKDEISDALTYLRVWRGYEDSNFNRGWCFDNFLNCKGLDEVRSIRSQLLSVLKKAGVEISSTDSDEAIRRSVAAGLIQNLMQHYSQYSYKGVIRESLQDVFIHPGSSVFGYSNPRWVVCTEVVRTKKQFARGVSEVEPEWLPELAPEDFRFGDISLTAGRDGGFIATKALLQKRGFIIKEFTKVDQIEMKVSEEEARRIQGVAIKDAQAKGLVPMVFHEEPGLYYYSSTKLVSNIKGERYDLGFDYVVRPIPGVTYYCKIGDRSFVFGGGKEANPQFAFFDSLVARDEKAEELTEQSAIEKLKNAWSARTKTR